MFSVNSRRGSDRNVRQLQALAVCLLLWEACADGRPSATMRDGDAGGDQGTVDADSGADRAADLAVDVPDASPDQKGATVPWTRPPLPAPRDHRESTIYFNGALGTFRVTMTDRTPRKFGAQEPTTVLRPSPSGSRVAQELAGRVEVYGRDGTRLASFDSRPGLLGWTDEDTLLFLDRQGSGALHRARFDGAFQGDLPNPNPLPAISIAAAALSPEGALAVVVMEPLPSNTPGLGGEIFIVRTSDGSIVRRIGQFGLVTQVYWTADDRILWLGGARDLNLGASEVMVARPAADQITRVPLDFFACSLETWVPANTVLLGRRVSVGDVNLCGRYDRMSLDSGGPFEVPWLASRSFFPTGHITSLSPDGRKLAIPGGGSLGSVTLVDATSGDREALVDDLMAVNAVAWGRGLPGEASGTPAPAVPNGGVLAIPAANDPVPAATTRSGNKDCRTGLWVNRTPATLPPAWATPRAWHAGAFDSRRGVMVINGGLPQNRAQETMEWHGAAGVWLNRTAADGFGPRINHTMVYDARRQHLLAFGGMGRINGVHLNDGPWQWDATLGLWKSRGVVGPEGRSGAASVYDSGRDRWIISGGYQQTDLWEWDGSGGTWEKRTGAAPQTTGQLIGHVLAYDTRRDQVLMLGNRVMGPDVWVWNGTSGTFTKRPTDGPGPLPREWIHAAYDDARDRLMLFGGLTLNGTTDNDLWEWDPATARWTNCSGSKPGTPRGRLHGTLVFDNRRQALILFGGDGFNDYQDRGEVWEWYVP